MQPHPFARISATLAALGALTLVVACADGTAPKTQVVSISMEASASQATAVAGGPAPAPITGDGHTLSLTTMALTIADLRLERAGHEGADDHGVGSDDLLFAAGPLTIALPMDGGLVTLTSKALPAGTFSQLEAELETLHLAGSYDAIPFDVAVELSHDMELVLDPPITTDGGAEQNVTVAIDFSACFVSAAGAPVDPRALRDGGSDARRAFRDCVANRLRAFEDGDRNGRDRNGHGADDGANHDAGDDHGSDG